MKTTKIRLIAMTISLAAVMTGINAEAQRRTERSGQNNRSHRTERVNPRNERRSNVHRTPKHQKQKEFNNRYKRENKRDYQAERHYKSDRRYQHWDREYSYKTKPHKKWKYQSHKYNKKHWDNFWRHDRRYRYNHPHYGMVYKRFHHHPVRVRHYNRDYYFYGGQCFRYYNGIGYVRVDFPRNIVLVDLPFQYDRVWIGPHVYYRYGNMIFERCDRGYRLAPNINIQLSAHF